MATLTIIDSDEVEVVKLQIEDVNPALAVVAILNALKALKPKRAKRSDAGKSRKQEATLV